MASQNADGGWGYHPGSESGVEATSWVLLALAPAEKAPSRGEAPRRGLEWLCQAQLPDGSWPAFLGQRRGCWATALACLALNTQMESPERVDRGIDWLLDSWPAEGALWWQIRRRFFSRSTVVHQDVSFRGWSWTPGTASWVEPTAYALILLRAVEHQRRARKAAKRRLLGERMLYDRMCPGGGWNSGNPLVYGVAGVPQAGPTVWALLALKDYPERAENQKSLDWLDRNYAAIRGPGSVALSHLCLAIYGRPVAPLEPALRTLYVENRFFESVLVVAWATLALCNNQVAFGDRYHPRQR